MAPPAKNHYVSRWAFGVIGSVIVVLGGALLSVYWATTMSQQTRTQQINERQDIAISCVERNTAVQEEQLDNIEGSVEELKVGQREILKRLPAQ